MTTITFNYIDSYGQPSRGSLAFMPHRRHAANETEVLPKPFTVPLLNGEATVNLQPNSSSWVWIITEYFENQAKSFYTTIPDKDGIIPHTELVHISPSSIPAAYDAVEPAWWAEMRAYKQTVGETLLKSTEALSEAKEAIETGQESIDQTRTNASLAKAYFEQSRDYSYESKDFRDEAEQWRNEAQEQADRAATGPESAATRAENSATAAAASEQASRDYENQARSHAAEARADAQTAQTAASTAVTNNTQAQTAANTATTQANLAQGYANDLLTGPQEYLTGSQEARDQAQQHATDAQTAATNAENSADSSATSAIEALSAQTAAETSATEAENHHNATQAIAETLFSAPQPLTPLNDWSVYTGFGTLSYIETPYFYILFGTVRNGEPGTTVVELPTPVTQGTMTSATCSNSGDQIRITVPKDTTQVNIGSATGTVPYVSLTGVIIAK